MVYVMLYVIASGINGGNVRNRIFATRGICICICIGIGIGARVDVGVGVGVGCNAGSIIANHNIINNINDNVINNNDDNAIKELDCDSMISNHFKTDCSYNNCWCCCWKCK